MIENHGVCNIVAVIKNHDMNKKCFRYWPLTSIAIGEYVIDLVKHKKGKFCISSKLEITNKLTGKRRKINHYHVYNWPDHKSVKDQFLDSFVNLLMKLYS